MSGTDQSAYITLVQQKFKSPSVLHANKQCNAIEVAIKLYIFGEVAVLTVLLVFSISIYLTVVAVQGETVNFMLLNNISV